MFRRKSVLVLLAVFVAFGMLSVSGLYQGVQAGTSDHTHPTVEVTAGGSLTVTGTGMDYTTRAAGTTIPYTDGHKVALTINTNYTGWAVKCTKDTDLTISGNTIPSGDFTYASVWVSGSPAASDLDVYGSPTKLEFGTSPTNVADTHTTPAPAAALVVDVRYNLVIGPTQAAAAGYTATHTYTLAAY